MKKKSNVRSVIGELKNWMKKVGFVGNVWVSMNKVIEKKFFLLLFYKEVVKEIVRNNKCWI